MCLLLRIRGKQRVLSGIYDITRVGNNGVKKYSKQAGNNV